MDRLLRAGEPGGPSTAEALVIFERIRSGPHEGLALEGLVRRARVSPLPDPLSVASASALVDRGEPLLAESLLAHVAGPDARVLLADLRAARGDFAAALAAIERVLLLDLDHPGAVERRRAWRAHLGLERERPPQQDPSKATFAVGGIHAPFRLLREVARGGAGTVYEAEDLCLSRPVALKIYHSGHRDRAQLLHEARVAVALRGPGIVRVFDVEPEQGWLALEWAPLGALREFVRARSRELAPIERWALPLAVGLSRVHASGWVHHDVKPANVLLPSFASPVIGDFGSARRAGEPSPPGSLGYVSPERFAGRASHPKDDVYGFGRVIEDALAALGDPELSLRFRLFAAECTGHDAARPVDARALVTRLRIEMARR